jgi:hypothetical protein
MISAVRHANLCSTSRGSARYARDTTLHREIAAARFPFGCCSSIHRPACLIPTSSPTELPDQLTASRLRLDPLQRVAHFPDQRKQLSHRESCNKRTPSQSRDCSRTKSAGHRSVSKGDSARPRRSELVRRRRWSCGVNHPPSDPSASSSLPGRFVRTSSICSLVTPMVSSISVVIWPPDVVK